MLSLSVQIPQLLAIAIANFVLSWAWYSPVLFVKPWMKALKIKPNHKMTAAQKAQMPYLFGGAILSSFLLSYVLQVLIHSLNIQSAGAGALLGALAWKGFALTGSLGTLWEGRTPILLLINNGLFLTSYVLFGVILAIWH